MKSIINYIKTFAVGLAFGIALMAGAHAAPPVTVVPEAAPEPSHVVYWLMVKGCPVGAFRMLIVLSNGHVVLLDESATTKLLQQARIAIGSLEGTVTAFQCGISS